MYLPPRFSVGNKEEIVKVIRSAPLATLITVDGGVPVVNHIPLVYAPEKNILIGHMARANEMWRILDNASVTAVFNGPNSYISPVWYPEDDVPTWNYAVVHVEGKCTLRRSYKEIIDCLRALSHQADEGAKRPWKFYLPEDLRGETVLPEKIVGFEISADKISAKFKLSQNRSPDEINGAITGLEADRSDDNSRAIANLMRRISKRD